MSSRWKDIVTIVPCDQSVIWVWLKFSTQPRFSQDVHAQTAEQDVWDAKTIGRIRECTILFVPEMMIMMIFAPLCFSFFSFFESIVSSLFSLDEISVDFTASGQLCLRGALGLRPEARSCDHGNWLAGAFFGRGILENLDIFLGFGVHLWLFGVERCEPFLNCLRF